MCAHFFYKPEVVSYNYGIHHPFRLERLWLTEYLCRQHGLFAEQRGICRGFEPAARDDLLAIHGSDYLDTLASLSDGLMPPGLALYGFGGGDNPIFPGLWEYSLETAGGSLSAAAALLDGETERVFHPGGGLHHAMRSRASGFCYVNDVALAINRFVEAGKRVFYLDLDAHHGDGVQEAFYNTSQVLTLSIHQDGRTLFPGTGYVQESGFDDGAGYCVNVPLHPGMGDQAFLRIWDQIVEPLLRNYQADILVTEMGADVLAGDPLAQLELHLSGWWDLLTRIAAWDGPWLAVGGGGYDLANAMRAWTLVWAAMVGAAKPTALPPRPEALPGVAADMRWPEDYQSTAGGQSHEPAEETIIGDVIDRVRQQVFSYHGL